MGPTRQVECQLLDFGTLLITDMTNSVRYTGWKNVTGMLKGAFVHWTFTLEDGKLRQRTIAQDTVG